MSTIPLPPETPAPTLEHLVSLPQLLQPISPHLAALQLARIRLLLSVPAGYDLTNPAKRWCARCGALREGAVEARLKRKKQTFTIGADEIPGLLIRGKRRWECSVCGFSSKKLVPPAAFSPTGANRMASARTSARLRKTQSLTDLQALVDDSGELPLADQSTPFGSAEDDAMLIVSPFPAVEPATSMPTDTLELHGLTDQAESAEASVLLSVPTRRPPYIPSLLSPRLSYIPSESPQPPTYTQPTTKAPGAPSVTGKDSRKKRKKSGLAKLLAENKERQEAEAAGKGSWGLD